MLTLLMTGALALIFTTGAKPPSTTSVTPLCALLRDGATDALLSDGAGPYCGEGTTPPHFTKAGQFVFIPRIFSDRAVLVDLGRCIDAAFCDVPADGAISGLRLITDQDVRSLAPGSSMQVSLSVWVWFPNPDGTETAWIAQFGASCDGEAPTFATVIRSADGKTWTLSAAAGAVSLYEETSRRGKTSRTLRACVSLPFGVTFWDPAKL